MRDPIRITTLTRQWWRLRRWFSPTEWLVRWIGLSRSTLPPTTTGLILIQVDGLSPARLQTAMERGQLRKLARMVDREHYQCRCLVDSRESDSVPPLPWFREVSLDPRASSQKPSVDIRQAHRFRMLELGWRFRWQIKSLLAKLGLPGTSDWPKTDDALQLASSRSLATTAAQIDCARGVPLIPLHLTGYFQLAKQFGPDSDIAIRELRDIDRTIGRIWHTAHAGAGREYDIWVFSGQGISEANGCLLAPSDITAQVPPPETWRRSDLQQAVTRFQKSVDAESRPPRIAPASEVRVMSYNVHACVGMDGELSTARIARVIAQSNSDVVCLQELDVHRSRSGFVNQTQAIADELGMHHAFFAAKEKAREQFGNAVLSRFPFQIVKSEILFQENPERSMRAAMWLSCNRNGCAIQIINTHLSIYPREQLQQARQLVDEWITPARKLGPVVVCGDFNARPGSATHQTLASALRDVEGFDRNETRPTYFSPFPVSRFDHMFVSEDWQDACVQVIGSRLAQTASDHLPLVADLKLRN